MAASTASASVSSRDLVAAAVVSVSNKTESPRMVCGRLVEESGTSWPGKTDGSCRQDKVHSVNSAGTEHARRNRKGTLMRGRGEISRKTIEKAKRALDRPIAGEDLPSPVRWRAW